jgi:hypothetical protein
MFAKECAVVLALCITAVLTFETKNCKVDVAFCVDSSGSIGASNWPLMLQLVNSLVKKLNIGPDNSHAGLVQFGTGVYEEFNLGTYSTEAGVTTAVSAIQFKNEGTVMAPGLKKTFELLGAGASGVRAGVPKLLVFITDGQPQSVPDKDATIAQVKLIKDAGVRVVTIGISSAVDETFLKPLASTDADYSKAADFNSLTTIADLAVNEQTCKPPAPPTTTTVAPPPTTTTKAPPLDCVLHF